MKLINNLLRKFLCVNVFYLSFMHILLCRLFNIALFKIKFDLLRNPRYLKTKKTLIYKKD